ncbi:MAG: hypothetical protein ACLFVQ_05585 [Chitinispirillaceae bacterium]
MNELKNRIITQARERYEQIFPCSSKEDLAECFTTENETLMFWFNTEDKSTHLITACLQ